MVRKRKKKYIYERWPNTSTGNDKVIITAHAPDGLDNLALIVRNHFDAL